MIGRCTDWEAGDAAGASCSLWHKMSACRGRNGVWQGLKCINKRFALRDKCYTRTEFKAGSEQRNSECSVCALRKSGTCNFREKKRLLPMCLLISLIFYWVQITELRVWWKPGLILGRLWDPLDQRVQTWSSCTYGRAGFYLSCKHFQHHKFWNTLNSMHLNWLEMINQHFYSVSRTQKTKASYSQKFHISATNKLSVKGKGAVRRGSTFTQLREVMANLN